MAIVILPLRCFSTVEAVAEEEDILGAWGQRHLTTTMTHPFRGQSHRNLQNHMGFMHRSWCAEITSLCGISRIFIFDNGKIELKEGLEALKDNPKWMNQLEVYAQKSQLYAEVNMFCMIYSFI